MYKVGDRVKFIELNFADKAIGFSLDKKYEIGENEVFQEGTVCVKLNNEERYWVNAEQIKKVEESKEMTFPEMVQKLIDGEFEVGTELENSDTPTIHYVLKNKYGYGLTDRMNGCLVATQLNYPSYVNGTWSVKEEPIKEMSIEEVQKELGYKIKIVERESK